MRNNKVDKDVQVLAEFIEIYCEMNHTSEDKTQWVPSEKFQSLGELPRPILCSECYELLEFSARRRKLCPLNPKPTCRNCEVHCYLGDKRDKIREVMRFSGRFYLKRAIAHMQFGKIIKVLTHLI